MTLYQLTFSVNFLALIASLWLGLYLVTRNPRSPTAWLTALTLWSLGGLFLNILLALSPPPVPAFRPSFLRFLFPFWPSEMLNETNTNAWLQGWSVAPSIAFWHHATMLMRPGKMNAVRWARAIGGYLIAFAAIEVQAFTQILFSVQGGDPLYLNSLRAGPLYSIFGIALIVITVLSVINLARSAFIAPTEIVRRQLTTLMTATLVTGLIVPVSLVSSGLNLFPMPMVVMSAVLAIFVGMIGYGVARYSALVEKRTIDRDFFYNVSGITAMVGIYTLASLILVFAYQAPKVIVIFFPLLGVFTHGLNAASIFLDWLFYRGETRRLRANLRDLRRLAGESENMKIMLEQILDALCSSIKATYGLILIYEDGTAHQIAEYRWNGTRIELSSNLLTADDFIHLAPGHFSQPLEDAALLVPLYIESEQVGALVLGCPANGTRFANVEVDYLLYPADQIAEALKHNRQNVQHLEKVASIANEPLATPTHEINIPVTIVENALRNLFDYEYLADTPLADMELVRKRITGDKKTYVERGKAIQAVMLEALDQMKPVGEIPRDPPPRAWYSYIILHDAYVKEVQNRDVMSKLYISEGTFNRTRRTAIRSLARTLAEMEHPN